MSAPFLGRRLSFFLVMFALAGAWDRASQAQRLTVTDNAVVSVGWHPWYEVKRDPEEAKNLILCGTRWDSRNNSPLGFVYISDDGGKTWSSAFEDKSSAWVTEHSCAFGPNHRAFFVSEASKVIDETPHHEFGKARIYTSADAGRHWTESGITGWADYSTSTVSLRSRRLFTFFNSFDAGREEGGGWSNQVGLIVYSEPDGKIRGPFLDASMPATGYRAAFPSDATALPTGAVVALFYGDKHGADGGGADIGIVHATDSDLPVVRRTVVARVETDPSHSCDMLGDSSVAYDGSRKRLLLVYVNGCRHRNQILLSASDDEGQSWTKAAPITTPDNPATEMHNLSLAIASSGRTFLLWCQSEGQGGDRWLVSEIRDGLLKLPALVLTGREQHPVISDALRMSLRAPSEEPAAGGAPGIFRIQVGVLSYAGSVWRGAGLLETSNGMLAIWSEATLEGSRLVEARIGDESSGHGAQPPAHIRTVWDVTRDARLLYSSPGSEAFDHNTGRLKICLSVANRSDHPFLLPLRLTAEEVASDAGRVTVLNATNGSSGKGAEWDISRSITGDLLPPRSNTHPVCLLFHIDPAGAASQIDKALDLLHLELRVWSGVGGTDRASP